MTGLRGSVNYPTEEWSAGVDWLTMVYDDADQGARAAFRAEQWQESALHEGDRRKGWSLAGFGGSLVGNVAVGRRGRETVVQVTSAAADRYYGALTAIGGRPSRLDLALTATVPQAGFQPPQDAYSGVSATGGRGRRTDARTLIVTTKGGATCYVGAPSSEQRLRVYDKGAEDGSAPPGRKWRWEVQSRRAHARSLASVLAATPTRQSAVAGLVVAHCERVGVRTPAVPILSHTLCGVDRTTDAGRALRWLATGVRPAVERIWPIYGLRAILEALGIPESAVAELAPHQPSGGHNGTG